MTIDGFPPETYLSRIMFLLNENASKEEANNESDKGEN